jgi:guanine deaminase
MYDEQWMKEAVRLATENVASGHGGPFGAVIVKDGAIIGRGCNEVTASGDPTAHAEVQAIRDACKAIGYFQLKGCVVYTSCEPCPMCIGAIYWARPDAVYYAVTKEDAASIGFDDQFIYEQIALPVEKRFIAMKKVDAADGMEPFDSWRTSVKKLEY